MAALAATIQGRLQLVVGDAEPIDLGTVRVPVTARTTGESSLAGALDRHGHLILATDVDFSDVRQLINQIFNDAKEAKE